MSDRIFVTGASGFVGSSVIKELRARSFEVNALVNQRSVGANDPAIRSIKGSLFDPAALSEGMMDCQAVIHLVGIIKEQPSQNITFDRIHFQGTQRIIDAAKRAGVRRYLHMSALGARPEAASNYHQSKYQAEQYIRQSGLDWTIFRPSLIHGPAGEFMQLEAKWARGKAPPFLFMPYFGAGVLGLAGAGKLQPIFVEDVARVFVDALENPKTMGEVYPIAGPQEYSWPDLHRVSAQHIVGRRRMVLAVPAWYAKMLTYLVPGFLLPFNRDQVIMSQENNTCDLSKFRNTFGWEPRAFREMLTVYASEL